MQLDQDDIDEIISSFREQVQDCERFLADISSGSSEPEDLNSLFRALHCIKGNAAMVGATVLVNYTHSLEEVVDAIRGDLLSPTSTLCEALLLGLDRLGDLHERELCGQSFDNLQEKELEQLFSELSGARDEDISLICKEVIELFGAGFIDQNTFEQQVVADDDAVITETLSCVTRPAGSSKLEFDLDFFKELALQVDKQSQFWVGRSQALLSWALKMNDLCDKPINSDQLAAAVYMHDIGMSYISALTLDKSGTLTEQEKQEIKQHPLWGYNYLIRIEGWDEASTIVLEHHERVDGQGYPLGIKGDLIHPGAKILAILDAYYSITHDRADRASRKSIVRAICDINARKGSQFDENWVNIFNDVIKNELKRGEIDKPAA